MTRDEKLSAAIVMLRDGIAEVCQRHGITSRDGPVGYCTEKGTPYVVCAVGQWPKKEGEACAVLTLDPLLLTPIFLKEFEMYVAPQAASGKVNLLWRRLPEISEDDVVMVDFNAPNSLGNRLQRITVRFAME